MHTKEVGDGLAGAGVLVTTITDWMPHILTALSIIWLLARMVVGIYKLYKWFEGRKKAKQNDTEQNRDKD